MRAWIWAAVLCLAQPASAAGKASGKRDFERLSSLLGHWEAQVEGKPVRIWYKLISAGTALLETQKFADEPEMVTLYHLDGEELLATHYCSANNQPRLKAVASDDEKEIRFAFRDITNLSSPEASHMRALRVRLEDADHFVQRWTWREKGKEETAVMSYERKKPSAAPPAPPESPPGR